MIVLELSERNIRTLYSKLLRKRRGEVTRCAIIKHGKHSDTCKPEEVLVRIVEDSELYANREPGAVVKADATVLPFLDLDRSEISIQQCEIELS